MSSDEPNLSSQQQQLVGALRFGPGQPKTRDITGFIDDRFLPPPQPPPPQNSDFRRGLYAENPARRDPPKTTRSWNPSVVAVRTPSGEGSDDEDEDDEEDDDDVSGLFGENRSKGGGDNGNNAEGKMGNGNGNVKQNQLAHSSFGGGLILGSNREVLEKEHSVSVGQQTLNNNNNSNNNTRDSDPGDHCELPGRLGSYENAVTVAESDGEMYYTQYSQGAEGSTAAQKDLVSENGCGFSGRKDASLCSTESGDSLRAILSDPMTGALMDDAVILPCGHSFGGGGVQKVLRMKACFICSQSISEDSIAPNLSLRSAVQAFLREEELHFYRSNKRKRERFDQDKGGYGDSAPTDSPKGRGVQFPFAVTDRVIIKGNKRTPLRFVGREAVVTTQCLNGWYVVKTLDNAESVKLQYRSLAKVSDASSSKTPLNKMASNWL